MKIHPTAIIDPSAEIADDAEIGAYSIVGPKVSIGSGSVLMHHVSVIRNTTLGRENVVHPGCVLGADPQDKKFRGEESWLHVGDRNELREHVTVNRGTEGGGGITRVGDGCLLLINSHVAHDCILGSNVTLANCVLLGGHVVVEDGVGMGGMAAVHHFSSIGRGAFIGGMTRVTVDAPPYFITEGFPSRVRGVNRVGLHRQGVSEETIGWLKEAFRALFHDGTPKDEAIQRLRAQPEIPPEGEVLLNFMARAIAGKKGRALQP